MQCSAHLTLDNLTGMGEVEPTVQSRVQRELAMRHESCIRLSLKG